MYLVNIIVLQKLRIATKSLPSAVTFIRGEAFRAQLRDRANITAVWTGLYVEEHLKRTNIVSNKLSNSLILIDQYLLWIQFFKVLFWNSSF